MNQRHRTRRHDQPTVRRARERRDAALDLGRGPRIDWAQLHPGRAREGLDDSPLPGPGAGSKISEDPYALDLRRDLLQQLEPFSAQVVIELDETRNVSARLRHAIDDARTNRINGL